MKRVDAVWCSWQNKPPTPTGRCQPEHPPSQVYRFAESPGRPQNAGIVFSATRCPPTKTPETTRTDWKKPSSGRSIWKNIQDCPRRSCMAASKAGSQVESSASGNGKATRIVILLIQLRRRKREGEWQGGGAKQDCCRVSNTLRYSPSWQPLQVSTRRSRGLHAVPTTEEGGRN